MIKNIMLVASVLTSCPIFALEEMVICPPTITCDYDAGVCETPDGWMLDPGGSDEEFSGKKIINLFQIDAYKTGNINDPYVMECYYFYGNHSIVAIYTYVRSLIGNNWVISGFGKNTARCSDISDPNACSTSR